MTDKTLDMQRGLYKNIDKGIIDKVKLLREHGVETYESCEGGDGHAFHEPTIRFHGERHEGFRVLALALQFDLGVAALRRVWNVVDGDPVGADWELVFHPNQPV